MTDGSVGPARPAANGAPRMGLRTKLLILLLAFGFAPLVAAIAIGYAVSRSTITRQASSALEALAGAQAVHLATELNRERLLLRTIAGHFPDERSLRRPARDTLAQVLVSGLPEGGVFDGLRIVTREGLVRAAVALRNTAPHWPPVAPAADWRTRQVVVHREGGEALAFLVAAPLPGGEWLEGHVRREDFSRVFAIPQHLLEGVESHVYEDTRLVFVAHARDAAEPDGRRPGGRALRAEAAVPGTDWTFAAMLPLSVALAPVRRLRNSAVVAIAVLVLLIVVTGVAAARSVTTPLHELAIAARRFGREGQHQPIEARSADEVGALVSSFNSMAVDLQRSREEIEHLHARDMERAQQLASVGELASGVAHEIRNPLTGVRGALELALRRLPPDEPSRPLLAEAQQQLARIEDATAQLLRYARPPELRELAVDARLLVERALHVVAPRAETAGITLREAPDSGAVPVLVDPELMVQVLVNLMLNGIEAMGPGGVLTVSLARQLPDVRIAVHDTGPGVRPAVRADIFRPFFTTKHQGTGLGLSISQQIVARHHGVLQLEDGPGGGATFVVRLPLASDGGAS
ncbi:MAG TPA: ATP-binding protein [Gemmatimonadales bacterium]|nr:ATP-binding protein [Gemmatimonadales bacterium]